MPAGKWGSKTGKDIWPIKGTFSSKLPLWVTGV